MWPSMKTAWILGVLLMDFHCLLARQPASDRDGPGGSEPGLYQDVHHQDSHSYQQVLLFSTDERERERPSLEAYENRPVYYRRVLKPTTSREGAAYPYATPKKNSQVYVEQYLKEVTPTTKTLYGEHKVPQVTEQQYEGEKAAPEASVAPEVPVRYVTPNQHEPQEERVHVPIYHQFFPPQGQQLLDPHFQYLGRKETSAPPQIKYQQIKLPSPTAHQERFQYIHVAPTQFQQQPESGSPKLSVNYRTVIPKTDLARQHKGSAEYLDPLTRESLDSNANSEEHRYEVVNLQTAPDLQAARYQQAIKEYHHQVPEQHSPIRYQPKLGEKMENVRPIFRYSHEQQDQQKLDSPHSEQPVIYKYQIQPETISYQQLQPELAEVHQQFPQIRSKKAKYPDPVQYVEQTQPLTFTQRQIYVHLPVDKVDVQQPELNQVVYKPQPTPVVKPQKENVIRYRIQPSLFSQQYPHQILRYEEPETSKEQQVKYKPQKYRKVAKGQELQSKLVQPSVTYNPKDQARYQYLEGLRQTAFADQREQQPTAAHRYIVAKDRSVQIILDNEE